MKKVAVIIFTYKRAMLLHNCLETLIQNFENLDYPIHVIYHYDKKHEASYIKLQDHFKHKDIIFYKRENLNIYNLGFKLLRALNLIWILRWPVMLRKMNTFKFQLEEILKYSKNKFVSLCPDDMIYFDKTEIDNSVFQKFENKEDYFQYRYFTSNNFQKPHELDKNLKIEYFKVDNNKNFFGWSFKDKKAFGVWKYRFTIEGTIYSTHSLLKFLKPMIYHNPITLEAIGLWESRIRNFFHNGLSSVRRTAATYQINNVQKLVNTPSANFDVDLMMRAYMDGYKFLYDKSDFELNEHDTTPKDLYFFKDDKSKSINYQTLKDIYN